ncbi:MAG: AAA family ATPase [Candidatus Thiodiazotropha sp. (ex Ctena orbiculata)]|nr:AAA family ATPase [Candidatus Thiodiazotropha taylori]
MPVHTTEISIPRIGQLGGGQWELKNLTEVTVIFGRNGSGKSVMLRAWRDQALENVHYVTPERTGEMDLQPQFMREELEATGRKNASSRNYMPEYRRRIVARIQAYFMSRGNYRGNTVAPGSPHHIEKYVSSLLTDFNLAVRGSAVLPYELKRLETDEIITNVDQLSSGEAQLVTIGLDILTIASMWEVNDRNNRIVLIDEPDAHIHPDLQVRFADFLFQIASHFNLQLVIATHSTSLLAAVGQFGGEDSSVIYLNRKKTTYSAQHFGSVQKELSACLGGHVLMGPLFGSPILLVEGDDDYRIWSQVPRHHLTSFAVIPSNGDEIKQYQKTLEIIFASLRENDDVPCGFALIDLDKPLPQPNEHNPQRNIKYIQLNCHESENLYLSDEVLADMGTDWVQAKTKIKEMADQYGNISDDLLNVETWDRRTEDIKHLINQLAEILDPKSLQWTVRLGKVIGNSRPQGQLSEYLGEVVVESLWPNDEQLQV